MKLMDVELMDVPPTARQTKNERPVEENLANDAWESRASLSTITSPTVSTSSNTVSDLSWPVTSGCSRAPGSASGAVSESEWELSCSQEREDQQSSFRAQISKIEQFLNTERLHLAKRRRIDN
ncbi:hypothetical protein INR49_005143 [Caranx melampygus]|nr:hypothetical protein INR49_005143 [Caranx melampygus]